MCFEAPGKLWYRKRSKTKSDICSALGTERPGSGWKAILGWGGTVMSISLWSLQKGPCWDHISTSTGYDLFQPLSILQWQILSFAFSETVLVVLTTVTNAHQCFTVFYLGATVLTHIVMHLVFCILTHFSFMLELLYVGAELPFDIRYQLGTRRIYHDL